MKVTTYVRDAKTVRGIDVTKEQLEKLVLDYTFISVSQKDKEVIEQMDDGEYVGTIMGDIDAIFTGSFEETPDCWLVSKASMKVYKTLNDEFNIAEAIALLKAGYKVARKAWNGNRNDKGELVIRMFLVYVPGSKVTVKDNTPYANAVGAGTELTIHEHLDLRTPAGTIQPGWVRAQPDLFATDYIVVG